MKSIVDYISKSFLSLDLLTKEQNAIEKLSGLILSTLAKNNQIFVCGNGGSSAQAAHFAG